MTCVNCGAEDTGKYCSYCAQPLQVKRLTFREGLEDFWNRIYGFDGIFLKTVRDLTLRPGYVAREYIRGNRVRYFGPIGYYFFMISVFLLLLSVIDLSFSEYMNEMQKSADLGPQQTKSSQSAMVWFSENLNIVALFLVPFPAFVSRYIFLRKQGLNFIEHSVPVFYLLGHWYWFQMVEATSMRYTGFSVNPGIQMLLHTFYVGFGYTTFVLDQPKWKTFLKGFGIYLLGYALMMVVIAILAALVIIAWLLISPETAKELLQKA